MCFAHWPQRGDAGEARTRVPSVSSQALCHWATALPQSCYKEPAAPRSRVKHSATEPLRSHSHVITGTNLCINKAIQVLLMHGFLTFRTVYALWACHKIDVISSKVHKSEHNLATWGWHNSLLLKPTHHSYFCMPLLYCRNSTFWSIFSKVFKQQNDYLW